MQLAMEAPIPQLRDIAELTDFDFALSHLLGNATYKRHFAERPLGRYLILDNSTNELHKPAAITLLYQQAKEINANAIILPDYENDANRTYQAVQEAIDKIGTEEDTHLEYWGVIQGSTITECCKLAAAFRQDFSIYQVAIPCDVVTGRDASLQRMACKRQQVVKEILTDGFQSSIHLLGLSDPRELQAYKEEPQIVSLDTGSPILNGLEGISLDKQLLPKGLYFDYYKAIDAEALPTIWYNIAKLRYYMHGGE